ncbi:hypothetical protein KO488_12500, partial [Poseidonibacter lekithochrous]|uniref:Calx-beta domain-containing protein n=1 Tax=Poseidonibacter TaxID=2321187 RepID=UPI001C094241
MKLTIKNEFGSNKVIDLNKDLEFNVAKGEQYIFSSGFSNYILNFKDNQESISLIFNVNGKNVTVDLNGIVPFLNENNDTTKNPTSVIINKNVEDKDLDAILENSAFSGSEILDKLAELSSTPVNTGSDIGDNLALISNFQTLLDSLGAAAAGPGGEGNATGNGSTFNSILGSVDDTLPGIAESDRWVNLSDSISSVPVDTNTNADIGIGDVVPPSFSVTDAIVTEGEYAIFNIQLSTESAVDTTFDLALNAGTAIEADYVPKIEIFVNGEWVEATSATIPAGETEIVARVETIEDGVFEGSEEFTIDVELSDGITSNTNETSTISILDSDEEPQITILGSEVQEEDGVLTFTVSLSNPSISEITVDFTTADGTALAGSDYVAQNGTITFAPGETSKTISISIIDDLIYEDSESMFVNLTNAVNATISEEQGEGKILDDGDLPTLSVSGSEVTEGEYAIFNIQLSTESAVDTTFDLALNAGTATEADYVPKIEIFVNGEWVEATSATIPAGETEIVARVETIEDGVFEGSEEFTLEATVT